MSKMEDFLYKRASKETNESRIDTRRGESG